MNKLSKISKWLLILVTLIIVLYTLLWVLVTYTIANDFDKNFAGKKFPISEGAFLSFSKVKAAGFPFKFMVQFEDFVEENEGSIIIHKSPFKVGYDILGQRLFSEYVGESIAKYKPENTGFGARITGAYNVQAHVPINTTLLRVLMLQAKPIELINFVNHFNIKTRGVHINDIKDDSVVIADADLDLKFSVKHHEYYDSIDELLEDIPHDYHFSLSAKTKDAAPGRRPVPFSMIYWTYLPTDFEYDIDLELHTEAKKFSFEDILHNFTLKTNKMNFYSKRESSKSSLSFTRNTIDDKNNNIHVNYTTKIDLGPEFSEHIAESINSLKKSVEPNSPLAPIKGYLDRIDTNHINFDTGDDTIDFSLIGSAKREAGNVFVDIENFGLSFREKGIELRMFANNNFGGEWLGGIFQISGMDDVVDYITRLSFRLDKSSQNTLAMNEDFWVELYTDFIKTIANNYNEENGNSAVEFRINKDVEKSVWGKYNAPKTSLIFYKKLYKALKPYTNNDTDRLKLFRKMIPSEVDKPEIIQKVTKE